MAVATIQLQAQQIRTLEHEVAEMRKALARRSPTLPESKENTMNTKAKLVCASLFAVPLMLGAACGGNDAEPRSLALSSTTAARFTRPPTPVAVTPGTAASGSRSASPVPRAATAHRASA